MAPHSSTLAWRIPWTEEPGRLQSMGSLRVGHDWMTSLSLFAFMHWRRKWQPTPVFLPGESQGLGEPGGLPSTVSYRVGHDWSDLAAAEDAKHCFTPEPCWRIFKLCMLESKLQRNWFCVSEAGRGRQKTQSSNPSLSFHFTSYHLTSVIIPQCSIQEATESRCI